MAKRNSEAAFSIDSFLNDSDVDDDDLLLMKPSGLKKVTSPTSTTHMEEELPLESSGAAAVISQEESASNSPASDTNSPQEGLPSEEDLDQKALKEAQRVFLFQSDYQAIGSSSLLKWLAAPVKGKRKGRNKYSNVYPCYICPNPEQAMAGHDDELHLNQRNDTLIRFMGYQVSYRNQIQAVPAAHLLDFNHQPSTDTNSTETEGSNTWCPTFMKMFLNSLRSQQEFKVGGSEFERKLKIKVEEKLLDLVLASVLDQEKKLISGETANSSVPEDADCEDDSPLEWQSPTKEDNNVGAVNEPTIVEGEKSDIPVVKNAPKRLRAGDIIECCPPHVVAQKSRLERSRVLECHPGEDPAVLVSTGHWLPRYHQIRIVQRLLRGQYEPCNGPFVRISDLILDKSQNHVMQKNAGPTLAERVGKVYKDTLQELSAFQKFDDTSKDDVKDAQLAIESGPSTEASNADAKPSEASAKTASNSREGNRSKRRKTKQLQQ